MNKNVLYIILTILLFIVLLVAWFFGSFELGYANNGNYQKEILFLFLKSDINPLFDKCRVIQVNLQKCNYLEVYCITGNILRSGFNLLLQLFIKTYNTIKD